jgi:hypothetical protein
MLDLLINLEQTSCNAESEDAFWYHEIVKVAVIARSKLRGENDLMSKSEIQKTQGESRSR